MEELKIKIKDSYCHVIKFGNGPKTLLILPGVSLCSLEGMGEIIEESYKIFTNDFTCYLISIRNDVYPGFGFEDIAEDIYEVAVKLNIENCYLYGVSMGGMVGLYIASKYDNYLQKMVICSSMCKTTPKMSEVAKDWIDYCNKYDIVGLNKYFINRCYSRQYIKTLEPNMDFLINRGTKKDCDRFKILSKSLLDFDVTKQMNNVKCKTLVIGDTNDNVIGSEGSYDIQKLLGCDIYMYDNYSHAVYDESTDIKDRLYKFMMEE